MPNVKELRICAGRLSSTTTSAVYGASFVASASNSPAEPLANLVGVLSGFNNIVTLHLETLAVRPVLEAWASLSSASHQKLWPKLEGTDTGRRFMSSGHQLPPKCQKQTQKLGWRRGFRIRRLQLGFFTVNGIPFTIS
jgi:hypothetical protein